MRFHNNLFAVGLASCLICFLVLALSNAPVADATGSQCAETYSVKRGDWLAKIARHTNTSVSELIRINPWLRINPNLIFSGQILCVRADALQSQSPLATPTNTSATSQNGQTHSQAVIEITYTYPSTGDFGEIALARGGRIGKRIPYPIELAEDAIVTFGTSKEIAKAINTASAPVFAGVRNQADDNTYTLIMVGDSSVMMPLLLPEQETEGERETLNLTASCTTPSIQNDLGGDGAKNVEITLWLESPNGLGLPFKVTELYWLPDGDFANDCFGGKQVAFVLLPATSGLKGQYRMVLHLNDNVFGPPGWSHEKRCGNLRQSRGRFYRWLSSWYGC